MIDFQKELNPEQLAVVEGGDGACLVLAEGALASPYKLDFFYIKWYTDTMYNWSTDTKQLKKDPKQYAIWRIEQMVNFGLDGKKLFKKDLRKYWSELHLDPKKKAFLFWLLWPKKRS